MNQVFHAAHFAPFKQRASLLDVIMRLAALRRQRRQLAKLEPHMLDDIGVTARDAATEARRALWDAPQHWHL